MYDYYNWIEENHEIFDAFVDEMENKYGVHDVDGDSEGVGYTSYEIGSWGLKNGGFTSCINDWSSFWGDQKKLVTFSSF